jgi:hypothetical protein
MAQSAPGLSLLTVTCLRLHARMDGPATPSRRAGWGYLDATVQRDRTCLRDWGDEADGNRSSEILMSRPGYRNELKNPRADD